MSRFNESTYREVQQFLFKEARLQDTHAFDEWEALWEDDAVYWVPANGHHVDPDKVMSIIYDNRSRIGIRIAQLKTGRRHTQMPRSELSRMISNIEVLSDDGTEIVVRSNMMIYEENLRGEVIWAAHVTHKLRRVNGELRMFYKKVGLVNSHKPVYTLSFLV